VFRGQALFGSADGHVYCVRLKDGKLAWKFRAAPLDRRIVVHDQLESTWPVPGSVLVVDGAAYFVAARTSYLDGGLFLYKLDARTGEVRKAVKLEVAPEKRDRGGLTGGYLPDVLSADETSIFMRSSRFSFDLIPQKPTVPHLWCSVGFLDDTWWHRTYWQFGTTMRSGWGGWPKAGLRVPSGRLLVTDGTWIAGYGRNQYDIPGAHLGVDAEGVWGPIGPGLSRWTFYRLYAQKLGKAPSPPPSGRQKERRPSSEPPSAGWSQRVPILVQAMVLADRTLFLAGPDDPLRRVPHTPSEVDQLAEALERTHGGRLLAVSLENGKPLSESPLASPPVFDGMAAAYGRLYLTAKDGTVVCLGPAE